MKITIARKFTALEDRSVSLADFIAQAQMQQPYQNVSWDSPTWDITASDVKTRAHLNNKKRLYFTQHAGARVPIDKRVAFESPFADLVKALLVDRRLKRGIESGPQLVFLRAARYLYDALPLSARRDPTLIARGYFVAAEGACLRRESASSAYRAAQHLEEFACLLDRHRLCRANIDFRSSTPRLREVGDRTSALFEERVKGLPTAKVLDALAEIANNVDLEQRPFDLLRVRLTELLFVGGFRIGEILTLPAKPLVREFVLDDRGGLRLDAATGESVERLGFRYWPEKGGEPIVKWFSTVANPLVLRALADIDRLCTPARDNATWLEANPGDVALLGFDDGEQLSLGQVAKIVGVVNARQWLGQRARGGASAIKAGPAGPYVKAIDLRNALVSDRFDKPVLIRSDGQRQELSESLFVMFKYDWSEKRPVNRFISVPVSWQSIKDFLCSRGRIIRSVFERYGHLDEAGDPYRIKTHDFRRLLNTIAQRGGLSQTEIAQWMGRRRVKDNSAYDLRSSAEMADEMRTLIGKNEVYGVIADQVRALPQTDRKAFLNARLTMLHATPLGDCGSSIAENPCETALSCLGGCRHYLRRKGDEASRLSIERIARDTVGALQRAREAVIQGKYNAENWVSAQETVLATARAALAIDDDASMALGELGRVTPDGPLIGKPL